MKDPTKGQMVTNYLLLQDHDILTCLFILWKESLADSEETLCEAWLCFVQVEWPEQSASQQPLGPWEPLAVQAAPAAKMADVSQKAAPMALDGTVCMLMGVGGAAALAVAVGTAWLYMAS